MREFFDTKATVTIDRISFARLKICCLDLDVFHIEKDEQLTAKGQKRNQITHTHHSLRNRLTVVYELAPHTSCPRSKIGFVILCAVVPVWGMIGYSLHGRELSFFTEKI